MTTETYLDLTYERGKGAKRPPRPKLLKLTDVSIPHRSRKKSKVKQTKDRSATLVRERIYDDPAYTEDISHLANPIRRGSVPGNHSAEQKSKCDIPGQTASTRSLLSKHQLPKEFHQYVSANQSKYKGANSAPTGSTAVNVNYDCGSSSSDNETMEPAKASCMTRRVRSLERSLAIERSDKKGTQKRNSKQKRNLSLDNSRYLLPGHPQHSALVSKQSHDFEDQAPSRKKYNESSVEAVQTEASLLDDVETAAEAAAKVAIGKRFLRGEIGIKSFNYYLLKEGLKSSKNMVTKQRNTLYSGEPDAKFEKMPTRSEENIYEEIFFKDTLGTVTTSITELATSSANPQPPDKEALQQVQKGGPKAPPHIMSGPSEGSAVGVFADCELCMEQCSRDNCEYCLAHAVQGVGKRHSQQPKETSQQEPLINQAYHNENNDSICSSSRVGLPAAHILEFQSYNPNNPGVYKIETTPVAITGDYNPILQFQQSSATTSTSTTTTPSDQQQPQQQQQQHIQPHQLQKPIYGGYHHPQSHQKPYHTTIVGNPLTSQYGIGGSLLLEPVAGSAAEQGSTTPRRPKQQQYIFSYQNGGSVAGGASMQLLNTKSSSSSDSLTQHKYNTKTRLEANVFTAPNTGDLYYAVGGTAPLHPLMYAASRPIGGSQILVDPYDPPQMYKSDSKASILSEFSLRSSDNSQRYVRYGPHRRHGGGRVSDASIFSIYSNSGQRRYFGSSESRFGYDCRRCSLDGIIGMGSGTAMGATKVPPDKCSYSDNCRYECRNCDCSSNYFSSDFDDMYGSIARGGSSGIPRKTAAGTLPSTFQDDSTDLKEKSQTPPSLLQQQFSAPLDLKQNKYAQDFFKHVNDVKRSIYQSEMQRNNSLESSRRGPRAGGNNTNSRSSPKRAVSQEPTEPVVTTLPLSRGRPAAGVRPTPAPRTSVQSQLVLPATFMPRDPTPTKRRSQPSGRREFPSLDRLVASNTGTIPKRHSRTMAGSESLSPKFTSKPKGFDAKDSWTGNNAEEQFTPGKRHHRTSSTKSHQNVPGPVTRRKDIPAPPPPSPATYSDLQELKANMEGLQDDTNSRSLESETSESPAVPSPSVRSLTGSHNEKKTRELAEAPLKITIALTDMNIPAEFCSTVSVLGHPDVGPDIGSVEQEDNDVFYDARSEDSGAGSLPSEVCLPQSKGAFGLVACSQEAACGKGSKETIYSERDVNTLPHTDPIAGGPEPSNISDTQGNDIGIASDDAKSKKQGRGTVEEQITPHDVEKLVGMDTCLQTNHWRTESEITDATLRGGKHEEKSSKTRDDEKTQTSAIEQHAAATCLEEKQTSLPALDSNDAPVSTSARANATDVDVDVDFEFSCTTGNTDSAALTHSDRTVDIPVVVTTAGIPAPSRTLTRQDYACLDSSEAQSDDSHLTRDSVTRESQNDELSSSTLEKLDVSTLPLPALPKRRRPRSRTSPSKNLLHRQRHEAIDNANANETSTASSRQQHLKPRQRVDTPEKQKSEISQTPNPAPQKQHLSASQQYVAKRRESLEASNRSFNEKLEARRMHNQIGGGNAANVTTGANNGVPTYLFGDQFQALGGGGPSSGRKSLSPATNKEEIYLNKSGWVQVNTKRGGFKEDSCSGFRRQQNDGTARSRAAGRVIPMDAQGHRTDLAHYSFIYQHQQQKSNVGIAEPKFVGSKVEELIQRNEARLGGFSSRDPALRPGYRIIDPQLASILNERPGFLPVKSPNDLDSPITPILSPPPAFQDNSRTTRQMDRRNSSRQQAPLPLPVLQSEARQSPQHMANGSVKGMVFSRSFEYDTRRPTPTNSYVETFSRSFDGHLSELPLHLGMPPLAGQHERSPNFSTLTGNSPNYLTKRESGGGSSGSLRSRDSSPKFLSPQTTTAYLNASVKEAPPAYSMSGSGAAATGTQEKYSPRSRHERSSERSKIHALGRSRKSQFNRMGSAGPPAAPPSSLGMGASRFRSFDTTKSQRLNSCDSGARSDLSNDELDNEDGGLSEFLSAGSQKFPKPCSSSVSISPFKMQRQRSLTPDRNESHSSSSSLRKQRSLTPESRSLTPEERRKKGSQLSLLGSRQNSGSRNNTLEARQRHGEKTSPNISRSSSSSSYSGGDSHDCLNASTCSIVAGGLPCPIPGSGPTNHRRDIAAAQSAAKQAEQEHRIRRSRSLQLSERSPNRVHKSIVNVCAVSAQQPQLQPKQPPTPSYQQPRLGVRAVFPPTVRTPPAANKIPAPLSASSRNTTRPGKNEADKARSFDFDYNNFNRSGGSKAKSPRSIHTSGSGGDSGGNQNQRIERETRSFDEEYREAVLNNNNGSSGSISGVRYLQPAADSGLVPTGSSSTSRLRQSSSPVNGSGVEYTASRSPQSSGSSSNILHQPTRKTGSPQSYGTRLCDHELTFEMLRKSPIMNFRRGDSSDFELPVLLRNRETINSGGNSELNFMSNETRIYEHPTTVLKPQRSLRQSPGSRDDLPLEVAVGVGGDYIYRPAPSQPRSSSASSQSNESTTTKSFSKTLTTCDYWPRCGACQYSLPVVTTLNQEPELKPHITTVAVNIPNVETKAEKLRPCVEKSIIPQWTFLCSGVADCRPQEHSTMTTNDNERRQLMAVVRPRVVPSASTSLFLLGEGNLCLANAAESENEACPQVLAAAEIGLRNLQDEHEFTEVNKKCRWRERSLSLPSPTIQRYLETEERKVNGPSKVCASAQ